jgi:hypothetical protein
MEVKALVLQISLEVFVNLELKVDQELIMRKI